MRAQIKLFNLHLDLDHGRKCAIGGDYYSSNKKGERLFGKKGDVQCNFDAFQLEILPASASPADIRLS